MDKNILYVGIFDTNNHYDCVGLLSQFNKNILCLFTKEDLYHKYNSLVVSNNAKARVIRDTNINIFDIISNLEQSYDLFAVLHRTKIIFSNNKFIEQNNNIIQIYQNNNPIISFFNKKWLRNFKINNITINSIFANYFIEEFETEKISSNIYQIYEPIRDTVVNKNFDNNKEIKFNIIYDDDKCAFVKILSINNIEESAVFIDKNTFKAYHINSLLVGQLLNITENNLIIEWVLDGEKVYCSY
jgi:hypothetical protein